MDSLVYPAAITGPARRFRVLDERNIVRRPEWVRLSAELRESILVAAKILPLRVNEYVLEELIDWMRVPEDPIFQLVFPQAKMLAPQDDLEVRTLMRQGAKPSETEAAVRRIRLGMNPQPAGQLELNVPTLEGRRLTGLQHKYRETVLFFPARAQTCHVYCTYCFRWAQFVNLPGMRLESTNIEDLTNYLAKHPEVHDVLITGGDPLVMGSEVLWQTFYPLLSAPAFSRIQNIRFGTKALASWPHRFVTDPDADALLRLFEAMIGSGRHVAIMAHYSHPVELSTPIAREAIRRVRATGAEIRVQAPIVAHVNDRPEVWRTLWQEAVRLGLIPYYLFVERDTGPQSYFEIPLMEVYEIFRDAYASVSGLARTVRGPILSTLLGKVRILGVAEVTDRKVFVLDYLQARDPDLVRRPFFAEFDSVATWFDQLRPTFANDSQFFELTSSDITDSES